ncbi:MAG: diguanylate cyclase domain-containing protein [Bacillota bacterium]
MIKILVVEDSKVSQKKILDSLYKLNYEKIDIASNGKQAIELVKNKEYDLIIMDIYLDNELDGIETSEKILEIFLVPIIFLTNTLDINLKINTPMVYLNKPFTIYELKHNIEIVLEQFSLKKSLSTRAKWFESLFEYLPEPTLMFDKKFKITGCNKIYKKKFHFNHKEISGRKLEEFLNGHLSINKLKNTLLSKRNFKENVILYFNEGSANHFIVKAFPVYRNNQFIGGYLMYIDITLIKQKEKEIRFLSEHDSLTGLFNRRYFQNKLENLSKSKKKFHLIIGDLDNLKKVNDTYGHKLGDYYIKKISKIFKSVFSKNSFISRIGGDEFGIIILKYSKERIKNNCIKIKKECKKITKKENLDIPLEISIGWSLKNVNEKTNITQIFNKADNMMYKDKENKTKWKIGDNYE